MLVQSVASGPFAELLFDAFVPRFTLRRRLRLHPDTFVQSSVKADVNVAIEKDAPDVNWQEEAKNGAISR
jgi:hypothetical protein